MLSLRRTLTSASVTSTSDKIVHRLWSIPVIQKAKAICVYVSHDNEVRTHALLEYCWKNNIACVVPKVAKERKGLDLYLIRNWLDLEKGCKRILEPKKDCEPFTDTQQLDCLIIPGVAFDKAGTRLGYGAGLYDTFLASVPLNILRIGLGYSFQIVDDLPREKHDQPMHTIITETQVITC